jgi:hypothetical protein
MSNTYEAQLQAERQMREQSQYDAIINAIAAAGSDAELAQRDYAYASSIGDHAGMADAQRRVARAESRLVTLESGRDSWDEHLSTRQQGYQQPQQQGRQMTPQDVIASMTGLTEKERAWLSERPHLVTDQRFITRLQDTYNVAAEKGLRRDSDEYFHLFNERLASAGGPVGMTPQMADHAKIAGVPNDEYMRQWNKMHAERFDSASLYGGRR